MIEIEPVVGEFLAKLRHCLDPQAKRVALQNEPRLPRLLKVAQPGRNHNAEGYRRGCPQPAKPQRQLEWRLLLPIAQVLRHTHPRMAEMETPQVPDWAAANRPRALKAMAIVDETLRDRPFIAGDRFTVADITGLVALDFAKSARITIPPELAELKRWHETLKARPSAAA